MSHSPHLYPVRRTPRVKLAGSVLALLLPENQGQVRGRLQQLSYNGGLLELSEPVAPEQTAELIFHLGSTTVRTNVGTLSPMLANEGCLQPFRFTGMTDEDRERMQIDLQALLGINDLSQDNGTPIALVESIQPGDSPAPSSDDSQSTASGEFEASAENESQSDDATFSTDENASYASVADSVEVPTWIQPVEMDAAVSDKAEVEVEIRSSPSQVVLYFDSPEDALHFTVAAGTVLSANMNACPSGELAKLFREFEKVNRVRTGGISH